MKEEGRILKCKILAKILRSKVPLFMVDAGLKKEAFVKCDEFTNEPAIGEEVELFFMEKDSLKDEVLLSYKKLIEHKKILELTDLKKRNRKISVLPGSFGKEVIWKSTYGDLRGTILSNKITEKKEVYIAKVLSNGFLCAEEKSLKTGSVVTCKILSNNEFFVFVEITGFPKFEGLIGMQDIKKSDFVFEDGKQIKAKIIHLEGTKATLSVKEIRDGEFKNNLLDFLKLNPQIPAQGYEINCEVNTVEKEGIFANITDDIVGFCSLKDLHWSYNSQHDINAVCSLQKGDRAKFLITDCIIYGSFDGNNKCLISCANKLTALNQELTTIKDNGKDFECQAGSTILSFKKISYFAVEPNQVVKFKTENIKLILSYKENAPNPYINFEKHHRVGSKVEAVITSESFENNEIFADVNGISCVFASIRNELAVSSKSRRI